MADQVYGAILDYIGDANVGLIVEKSGPEWSIYGASVPTGLNENRYLFVVVPTLGIMPKTTTLNNLDWVSFQTRATTETYNVPSHSIMATPQQRKMLSDVVYVINRTQDETVYRTDTLPIKVRLLHDKRKNNYLQYPDKAKLYQTLDTFRCVIELL